MKETSLFYETLQKERKKWSFTDFFVFFDLEKKIYLLSLSNFYTFFFITKASF